MSNMVKDNGAETVEDIEKRAEESVTETSIWLDALNNSVASVNTFTSCCALGDLHADGDNKLVVADLGDGGKNMKLKVFRGTSLMMENNILDLPTSLCTFMVDTNEPRSPAIAVASGPFIYIYKNLRPYFKFTLPPLETHPIEKSAWDQTKENNIDVDVLKEMLIALRDQEGVSALTPLSIRFLQVDSSDLQSFVDTFKSAPLKRQTVITCMGTLKKCVPDDDAISCLVAGTESKEIYVLDPEAFTILSRMSVESVPVSLSISGVYDVEFRIVVACRNSKIYILKRGSHFGKLIVELQSPICGMERIGKSIIVGCTDSSLNCYSTKGKKLWSVYLPTSIETMNIMNHKTKSFKAVMVALSNGEVRIFKDKYLINIIKCPDVVTALCFGRFGREDSVLILVTRGGALIMKILKRTANFEGKNLTPGPPLSQSTRLNVPRKTKLFVDQAMRERESASEMHRVFQQDLYKLRLTTARAYVKSLQTSLNPISTSPDHQLKLAAQVHGLGPSFKLTFLLQNTSGSNNPCRDLIITFKFNDTLYQIAKPIIQVPFLVPGVEYKFETLVECISDQGLSDQIRVFVLNRGKSIPIITAVITMPVSETAIVV